MPQSKQSECQPSGMASVPAGGARTFLSAATCFAPNWQQIHTMLAFGGCCGQECPRSAEHRRKCRIPRATASPCQEKINTEQHLALSIFCTRFARQDNRWSYNKNGNAGETGGSAATGIGCAGQKTWLIKRRVAWRWASCEPGLRRSQTAATAQADGSLGYASCEPPLPKKVILIPPSFGLVNLSSRFEPEAGWSGNASSVGFVFAPSGPRAERNAPSTSCAQ